MRANEKFYLYFFVSLYKEHVHLQKLSNTKMHVKKVTTHLSTKVSLLLSRLNLPSLVLEGIFWYSLLHLTKYSYKVLLYRAGSYIQYLVINYSGKEYVECMCVYN